MAQLVNLEAIPNISVVDVKGKKAEEDLPSFNKD